MPFVVENLPEAIRQVKRDLRQALPNHAKVFRDVECEVRRKVSQIVKERDAGDTVIPIVHYSEIAGGGVSVTNDGKNQRSRRMRHQERFCTRTGARME